MPTVSLINWEPLTSVAGQWIMMALNVISHIIAPLVITTDTACTMTFLRVVECSHADLLPRLSRSVSTKFVSLEIITLKVSLITLTNRAYSVNNML